MRAQETEPRANPAIAPREQRPPRRYDEITAAGAALLAECMQCYRAPEAAVARAAAFEAITGIDRDAFTLDADAAHDVRHASACRPSVHGNRDSGDRPWRHAVHVTLLDMPFFRGGLVAGVPGDAHDCAAHSWCSPSPHDKYG